MKKHPTAADIVALFGGQRPLARALGEAGHDIDASAINRWVSNGAIPPARWTQLRDLAAARGLSLSLEDLANAA